MAKVNKLLVVPADVQVKLFVMGECRDTPDAGQAGRSTVLRGHDAQHNFLLA